MRKGVITVFAILLFFSHTVHSAPGRSQRTGGVVDCTRKQASEEMCMACAIAMEAGNQPLAGKKAVGLVIMNRVHSSRFPNTICGVVNQKRREGSIRHAFSFLDWDLSEKIRQSKTAFIPRYHLKPYLRLSRAIAGSHLPEESFDPRNPGSCATYFATPEAARRSHFFRNKLVHVADVADHRFYRDPRDNCEEGIYRHLPYQDQVATSEETNLSLQ